jgi:dTDP-glucose pyrophosphorylase
MNKFNPSECYLRSDDTIRSAIAAIDRSRRLGIALVVDCEKRLVNTITDGDVRRGMLAGLTLDADVESLLSIKKRMPHPKPVVASCLTSPEERIRLMKQNDIRQLPLLNSSGEVTEIYSLLDNLAGEAQIRGAVVMAGGLGKRLHPLTESTPKPMLHVGGRPMLEIIFERLYESGIKKLCVTTHFKAEKIVEHFGDGSAFGVEIDYVNELSPLGTAGALGLMKRPTSDILVVNGDILTELDFSAMFDYHFQHRATLTVAVRPYEHVVPFGVVKIEDSNVIGIDEKPKQAFHVSAGIYVLSPDVFNHFKSGEHLDMPELISRLISKKLPVVGFLIHEKWVDIGRHADFEQANREAPV